MRSRKISCKDDLKIWVDEQMGSSHPSAGDKAELVSAIMAVDHPAWGEDWSEFLSGMPEDLYSLLWGKGPDADQIAERRAMGLDQYGERLDAPTYRNDDPYDQEDGPDFDYD